MPKILLNCNDIITTLSIHKSIHLSLLSEIASLRLNSINGVRMASKKERIFIQVQIDPVMKSKFASKVEQEGKTITDVILNWIDDYVNEKEKVDVLELKQRLDALQGVEHRVEALERLLKDDMLRKSHT